MICLPAATGEARSYRCDAMYGGVMPGIAVPGGAMFGSALQTKVGRLFGAGLFRVRHG